MRTILSRALAELNAHRSVVLVTIVAEQGSAPRGPGSQMLVGADGQLTGTIGGGQVERQSELLALSLLKERRSQIQHFALTQAGADSLGMACGGDVTVLFQFISPEDILWQHKPHVGTDLLRQVVTNLRKEIQALGGEVRFGHRLSGLTLAGKQLTEIQVDQGRVTYTMPCDTLILAPGHSARDTFRMLWQAGAAMEQKPFAIGVRIEHEQARISRAQFGESWEKLPPADYKLVCHLPNGRSAYTFCVCPGGQIVAAASQPGGVVTNGMSNRARDGKFINGGFLVGVGPGDFGSDDPLAGVAFQELWEAKAYAFGRPGYEAPAQRVGDLLRGVPTPNSLTHRSTYQPNVIFGDLRETLPNYVTDTLAQALPALDKKLHGFAAPDALLVGVETRSSSPVRILRGKDFQSDLRGLYPCGEGAGYAGGIVSAAVDGVRVAEAVAHPPVWTE